MTANVKVAGFNDKQPAWWGLGIQPDKAYQWADVRTGFEAAGMLYKLYDRPCITTFDGKRLNLLDRRIIVREPSLGDTEPTPLDVVSDNFVIIQNEDIAEYFNPLCDVYKLATFGVLDEGRIVWLAFETDEFDIAGDPFKGYLFAYGKTAGGGSFGVGYTSVRIVCQNTFMMAENKALNLMKFSHKGQVKDLVKMRAWAETEVASQRQQAIADWELLVKTKVTAMQTADIIEAAFPEPKQGAALALGEIAPGLLKESFAQDLFNQAQKQMGQRVTAMDVNRIGVGANLVKFNDEFPQFAGTAYAVVNAVTEYADWPARPRSDTPKASLFGYRNQWKQRAMKAAMKIARPKIENN